MKNYFYASTFHTASDDETSGGGKYLYTRNVCMGKFFFLALFIPSNVNWWENINFPQPNEKREKWEDSIHHEKKVRSDFSPPVDDAALMIFLLWTYIGGVKNIIPSSYLLHICMNVYAAITIIYFMHLNILFIKPNFSRSIFNSVVSKQWHTYGALGNKNKQIYMLWCYTKKALQMIQC